MQTCGHNAKYRCEMQIKNRRISNSKENMMLGKFSLVARDILVVNMIPCFLKYCIGMCWKLNCVLSTVVPISIRFHIHCITSLQLIHRVIIIFVLDNRGYHAIQYLKTTIPKISKIIDIRSSCKSGTFTSSLRGSNMLWTLIF